MYSVLFSLVAQMVKNLPAMQETQVQSLAREDPLEKGIAIHSSSLSQRVPQKPGGLESMDSQSQSDYTFTVIRPRTLGYQ